MNEAILMELMIAIETRWGVRLAPPLAASQLDDLRQQFSDRPHALMVWSISRASNFPFFALLQPFLPGFPFDNESPMAALRHFVFYDGERVLWDLEHTYAGRDNFDPTWLLVGDDGGGNALVVDSEHALVLWSAHVDNDPELITDNWVTALDAMLRAFSTEQLRITESPESAVVWREWAFDRDEDEWRIANG